MDGKIVKVRYVDFGYTDECSILDIAALPASFTDINFYAAIFYVTDFMRVGREYFKVMQGSLIAADGTPPKKMFLHVLGVSMFNLFLRNVRFAECPIYPKKNRSVKMEPSELN